MCVNRRPTPCTLEHARSRARAWNSQQMESFFMGIARDPELPGYEEFEKQAWGFKVRYTWLEWLRFALKRSVARPPQR